MLFILPLLTERLHAVHEIFKETYKQLSKPLLTNDPTNVNQNHHQNIIFLLFQFHAKYSISWNLLSLATIHMSYFWFAYNIAHDIRIRAQRTYFKKKSDHNSYFQKH